MAKQRNAVRAGIFMLVSLALILFVIVAISGAGRFTQVFTIYSVAFSLGTTLAACGPEMMFASAASKSAASATSRFSPANPASSSSSIFPPNISSPGMPISSSNAA